jgi:tetratricopeptide (TPR) repeat protein
MNDIGGRRDRDGRGTPRARKPSGGAARERRSAPVTAARVSGGGHLRGGALPSWVVEEIARVAPGERGRQAIAHLEEAVAAFVGGRYGRALQDAEQGKECAPRDPTMREVIGLSAYRLGRWEQALAELRTFRRLAGDTTHLPVEMDALRALERDRDVEVAWALLRRLGGTRTTMDEGRVVYGSFLLDRDRAREAWEVTRPPRIGGEAEESELRVWYVASRAAARMGDLATARRLYEAIQGEDPSFPGLDDLERAFRS